MDDLVTNMKLIVLSCIITFYVVIGVLQDKTNGWEDTRTLCYTETDYCDSVKVGLYSWSGSEPICYTGEGRYPNLCADTSRGAYTINCMREADVTEVKIEDLYAGVAVGTYFALDDVIIGVAAVLFLMHIVLERTRRGWGDEEDEDGALPNEKVDASQSLMMLVGDITLMVLMIVSLASFTLVKDLKCSNTMDVTAATLCKQINDCEAVVKVAIPATASPALTNYRNLTAILTGLLLLSQVATIWAQRKKVWYARAVLPTSAEADIIADSNERAAMRSMMVDLERDILMGNSRLPARIRLRRDGEEDVYREDNDSEERTGTGTATSATTSTGNAAGIIGGDETRRQFASFAAWDEVAGRRLSSGRPQVGVGAGAASHAAAYRRRSNRIAAASVAPLPGDVNTPATGDDDDNDDDVEDSVVALPSPVRTSGRLASEGAAATAVRRNAGNTNINRHGTAETSPSSSIHLTAHVHRLSHRQRMMQQWCYMEVSTILKNTALYTRVQEQGECSICLCPLMQVTATGIGSNAAASPERSDVVLVQVPCQHWFHRTCLLKWIATSFKVHAGTAVPQSCPICRADIAIGEHHHPASDDEP